MKQLRLILDTHRRNFRLTQWPVTVLDPLEEVVTLVEAFLTTKASIDADPHLAPAGRDAARVKAGRAALDAIQKWHAPRLAGLDADLDTRRAALLPAPSEPPDGRRIEFLLSHLRDKSPEEIAAFYNSATDEERRTMEAAAASVGRIPTKTGHGLEWRPLLDPETVNESLVARATAKNPQGARMLEELTAIRALHVTVAGIAAAEVKEAMGGLETSRLS